MIKKAFTLLELLMVLLVLGVLIQASRSFFANPNQYVLDGEVCINKISWELHNFFYNAITWKSQYKSWLIVSVSPDSYRFDFGFQKSKLWNTNNKIALNIHDKNYMSWLEIQSIERNHKENIRNRSGFNITCEDKRVVIFLSGGRIDDGDPSKFYSLTVNKQVDRTNRNTRAIDIKICDEFGTNCERDNIFEFDLEYRVCPNDSSYQCIHVYTDRFDSRTKTIKTNKCLWVSKASGSCLWRSSSRNFGDT